MGSMAAAVVLSGATVWTAASAATPSGSATNPYGVGASSDSAAATAPDITTAKTFSTLNRLIAFGPSKGFPERLGSYDVFTEAVADLSGHRIGTNNVNCMIAADRTSLCRTVVSIKGKGQISLESNLGVPGFPLRFEVTGGTGAYANVRGQVRLSFPDGHVRYTFALIP